MPPYGEADWATPGNTSSATEQTVAGVTTAPANATGGYGSSSRDGGNAKCYIVALSLFNIGLAAMMGALGILTLISFVGGDFDFSSWFLSAYMVIFATLLFLYELMSLVPMASVNVVLRKNFGFLYGLRGKGFYMIFIAFLTIGLLQDDTRTIAGLDWATGIGWLFSGLLHIFVSCTIPGSNDLYKPPTVGLSAMGEPDANNNSAV